MKFLSLLGNQDDSKLSMLCANIGSMNLHHSTPLKADNQGNRIAFGFEFGSARGFHKIDNPVFGAPANFTNDNRFGAYDLKPIKDEAISSDGKIEFGNGHELKEFKDVKAEGEIKDLKAEGEIKEDKDIKPAKEDKN